MLTGNHHHNSKPTQREENIVVAPFQAGQAAEKYTVERADKDSLLRPST
jgi:hypothetical protein